MFAQMNGCKKIWDFHLRCNRYQWVAIFLFINGLSLSCFGPAKAQTNFTVLKSFNGAPDASVPFCTLVVDSNNFFYGTTIGGGISNYGAIFSLSSDGTVYKLLKSFLVTDGSSPRAGLLLSTNGSLYGTTYSGGTSNLGTVFTIRRDGTGFMLLHSFTGTTDGANPEAALIEGSDGALYGTTYFANSAVRGTIFKINKDRSGYSILHTFTGMGGDGQDPVGKLLEGSDGYLYGTTAFGGSTILGTLFTIAKNGNNYSVLHTFGTFSGDGQEPQAGLIEISNQLYGTTYQGGLYGGQLQSEFGGTVFKINKDGNGEQILHDFSVVTNDLQSPNGDLLQGLDGSLYGVTYNGGGYGGVGAVYKLNTDGAGYQILHDSFGSKGDEETPRCALIQLKTGILYGTSELGGAVGPGCVFALSASPLQAELLPLSVKKGSNVVQSVITSGLKYNLLRSTNLASWSTVGTIAYPTNSFSDTNPPYPAVFYRLKQN
jgi:uncharacterized repeat protein (TIGR03803 family)